MAPEVLRCPVKEHPLDFKHCRTLQYNTSVDVWAVGVLAYELLVGFPPFSSSTPGNAMHKIMAATVVFPRHITPAAQDFVSEALRSHPGERPTIAEMSASAWLNGGKAKVRGWHDGVAVAQGRMQYGCSSRTFAELAAATFWYATKRNNQTSVAFGEDTIGHDAALMRHCGYGRM
jgi:hypothetical protein